MSFDRRITFYLIKTDLITMNGGKSSMKVTIALTVIICAALTFMVSPIAGIYCPTFLGCMFVPMMFKNEIKYHSEKMFSLLPVRRQDIVNSRFLFTLGLYAVITLLFYPLMLLSDKLKLYNITAGEDFDVLEQYILMTDSSFTKLGLLNLLYFGCVAFGLVCAAGSLHKYFRDSEAFSSEIIIGKNKLNKNDMVMAVLVIGFFCLWLLIIEGIIPLGLIGSLIIHIIGALAQAADGFLLGILFVSCAVLYAIYKYVCTVLEYDEREL